MTHTLSHPRAISTGGVRQTPYGQTAYARVPAELTRCVAERLEPLKIDRALGENHHLTRLPKAHLKVQSASMWLSSVGRTSMPASLNAADTDWSRLRQVRDRAASPGRW